MDTHQAALLKIIAVMKSKYIYGKTVSYYVIQTPNNTFSRLTISLVRIDLKLLLQTRVYGDV